MTLGILEDAASWFVQYWQIPAAIAAGAVAELLFREFIYEEWISPSLKYKLRYWKNHIKKRMHNTNIELSYSSRTADLSDQRVSMDKVKTITDALRQHHIPARGNMDIMIDSYQAGKMSLSGAIEFSTYSSAKGELIRDFTITLTAQVRYNSMNDEIPALIQHVSKIKEYVGMATEMPLTYSDNMSCRLAKLVMEMSHALKDMKVQYVKIGGDVELSMNKERVVFHSPSDASLVVPELRKLVVLYG